MPDSISPSMKPPQSSGGALYIVAVIALVAAIGGLVCWKLKGNDSHPTTIVAPPAVTTPAPIADPPPPPPPVVETAGPVDAGGPSKPAVAFNPCSNKCTGTASGALSSALSSRAGSARPCYEHALRGNASLQGKLMINVRLDTQGSVCAASVVQDAIHSAEVSNCVLNMFRSAKFPAPTGGCVEVNVPLSFVPREGK